MTLAEIKTEFDCRTLDEARAITQEPGFPEAFKPGRWEMRAVLAWRRKQKRR